MLKIGLFGVGHLGKFHLKSLLEIPEFEVVGFFDPDDEAATFAEKEYNVPRYTDQEKLIEQVQLVDIVTPTIHHFDIASNVIKKSKHVFIEKPVTSTVEEAEELLKLSREANVKVQIGHVERYNPAFQKILPYLKQPRFIEAHRLAEFNPRGTDVPVIHDLMIHDIDIILSVVKSHVKSIHASGVAILSQTPDIANARLEFANGCVANLTASRISMKNMRKTRFFQPDAYLSVDYLKKTGEIITMNAVDPNQEINPLAIIIEGNNTNGPKEIKIKKVNAEQGNAIKNELQSFYNSIIEDTSPEVDMAQGYEALKIAADIIDKMN